MTRTLAIDGGTPLFSDGVPFVRAPAPSLARVTELLEPSWSQGMLTNGPLVRKLEEEGATLLGVDHVVAVASCTTGLMLVIRALDMRGDVLLPSFTFSASAHAIAWNGLRPRFAECDPASFQLAMDDATSRSGDIGGILATHVFGAPCVAEAVVELGRDRNVPVVFDAAHAIGSLRDGTPVSRFGDASVFSMTPTKPLVAGEGGLVATNRADLAHLVRIGRDYANPGDYDTQFVGLNGRLSEMHAAVALASLEIFPVQQKQRDEIAGCYRDELAGIPGVRIQHVDAGDVSTYKDFTIAVDADQFGCDRDTLRETLTAEGVDTRCYFDPPVHRQTAYAANSSMAMPPVDLPVTDATSRSVLSLPIYPALGLDNVARLAALIGDVHAIRAR
ncbi:MAG TPA: DegT/DnrJ/EryC1/StrS family aminotransferase [Acidimicrobiia bacterium]|nr:DegT/DnrJ/EryC1/StrS family aminotransferase [Acidimicrobiia bacterium]